MTGAVLAEDKDPKKQAPIAFATVVANARFQLPRTGQKLTAQAQTKSDASGFFQMKIPVPDDSATEGITLSLSASGYQSKELPISNPDEIQVLHMLSLTRVVPPAATGVTYLSKSVRVRYSEQITQTSNVGSVVKTFEVPNKGNERCRKAPCSPDGKWQAANGAVVLEGQQGTEFRNIRLSCIAGPCPFTKIESEDPAYQGHNLRVVVKNWSDTTSFLLEAEVSQKRTIEVVREAYAAVFGSSVNFTLPATAQGASILAEVNGHDIVFPLGPALILSWGVCSLKVGPDHTRSFHCDLKPGYQFR